MESVLPVLYEVHQVFRVNTTLDVVIATIESKLKELKKQQS